MAACWCGDVVVCMCWCVLACAVCGCWSGCVCWSVLVCAGVCCGVCWCVAWASLTAARYIVGRLAGAQVVVVGVAVAILRRLEAGRQGGHHETTRARDQDDATRCERQVHSDMGVNYNWILTRLDWILTLSRLPQPQYSPRLAPCWQVAATAGKAAHAQEGAHH